MPTHVVRQGEFLSRIARRYGFLDWRIVYDHPQNAELRRLRPDPNVIAPGDRVFIPEKDRKTVSIATGSVHRFKVVLPTHALRVVLRDHGGRVLANEPYVLEVAGERREGATTGEGMVEERVSLEEMTATLTVRGRTLTLRIGHLNPIAHTDDDGVSGVQSRLANLGYNVGAVDGKLGPRTRSALAIFQADMDLEITGEPDDATVQRLIAQHGC